MSVVPSDIVIYGATSMPESDTGNVGGAIDFTKRVDFFDVSPNGTLNIVSSSASDTGVKIATLIRDAGGATQTATTQYNGTVLVGAAGGLTAERILMAAITGGAIGPLGNPGGTAPVGDCALVANTKVLAGRSMTGSGATNTVGTNPTLISLASGDVAGGSVAVGQIIRVVAGSGVSTMRKIIATSGYGPDVVAVSGTYGSGAGLPGVNSQYDILQGMLFERLPNSVLAITRLFSTAAADTPGGSTRTFYEKVFVVNNNTATTLTGTGAAVALQVTGETPSLPGGVTLDMGPDTGFNGTAQISTRQVAPGGISFTTQPANVFVPGSGNLLFGAPPNSGNSLALWMRLTVPAGSSPYKGAATVQTLGNTT